MRLIKAAVLALDKVDKSAGGGGEEAIFFVDNGHGAGKNGIADGETGQPVQIGSAGDTALL